MPSTVPASSRINRLARGAAKWALAGFGIFCALLLAIRVIAFPQIEARRTEIAHWLGARIGQPVEIDGIDTGWDGWNPKLAVRGFRLREPSGKATVLELPRVDLVVAWTSLPLRDLRLKELTIESPRLAVRRDGSGRLHIGGIEMETDANADDSAFADWLLRQPRIVVRDALVTWNDELRQAPQLLLDHVQFRLEQRFGRHRAGLTGVPPAELAAPIDLRADVTGSLRDLQSLRGKVYVRLDYADVAAWREWLPLPFAIDSGKGALRVWLDVAQSRTLDATADLELADVRATLGEHLPPLALAHLSGRAGWKRTAARSEFTATRLSFELPDGTGIAPTDLRLTLADPDAGAPGGGSLAFRELALRPLATIAGNLPLPDALRRDIAAYQPQGTLANGTIEWSGSGDAYERYAVKAEIRDFGVAPHDAMPGVARVSGSIEASERGGEVRLAGPATFVAPRLFAEPLAFERASGRVSWQRSDAAMQVSVADVAFANADVAGTAAGTWRSLSSGPGQIDLKVQLTRASLAGAYHYLPAGASPAVRDWLRRALAKGTSSDARLTLAGDLAALPFTPGRAGQLEIVIRAQDATLQYAEGWPPITAIDGEVRIEGTRLAINATGGRVRSAQIGATRAEIPDMRDPDPVLRIDGAASGPTSEFLAFVRETPVSEWIGHVTDDATASGDGRLALRFELPLHDRAHPTIAGGYQFVANTVRLGAGPALAAVNGQLAFTEHDVRATDISAEAYGGPVKLSVAGEAGGRVRVTASGTVDVQRVRSDYDAPLLDRVSGTTDWRLALEARERSIGWTLESSLQGAGVDLPAPIGKRASETVPLRIERREIGPREDRIAIDYGRTARVVLRRQTATGAPTIDRALVLVGKAITDNAEPEQPGAWIRADVAAVNLDDWLDLDLGSAARPASGEGPSVDGIDLQAGTVQAFGRTLTRLKTVARRQNADWRLTLDGNELAGNATWRAATPAQPNGRLVARLARLTPPPAADTPANGTQAPAGTSRWPAVDVVADVLQKKGRALGRLELLAQPAGADWQIQKLALATEAGRIDAQGWWRPSAAPAQTRLDVVVDVKEAGAFLSRFGWPDAVKAAPTRIEGEVSWAGSPGEFDYTSLAGTFKLHSGAGQFTKLDPGVGRLLGVLSLQALPRRISLDFRDVFSEGFAFDSVSGEVRMQSGVMHTGDFRLVGPAAAVNIAGDVDLARETQQLKVRVQPSLSSGVSAGAAALFIANPLIGAAVGAGTLLAQKMLNNPFDKLFSYEYAITGSWDDPVVTRAGARDAAAASSAAAIR
jgi:uncharacterized protein (TIGR02099 family)